MTTSVFTLVIFIFITTIISSLSQEYRDSCESQKTESSHCSSKKSGYFCPLCLVWKDYGYPCEQRCDSKTRRCHPQAGCYCPGNLKLDYKGRCVHECPKHKRENCCDGKKYICGNSCTEKCGYRSCDKSCENGCFCPVGTKIILGVCQPESQCPNCTSGKVYNYCGGDCKQTCGCVNIKEECNEGCYCNPNEKLIGGRCLPMSSCPP